MSIIMASNIFRRYMSTQKNLKNVVVPQTINKILIANRGEIACRIVRTARRLGIKTVAVYSDADAKSLHVEMADEAYNIGLPPSQQSYLRSDKIINVAKKSGCQAIHPGYGFLSESVEFAELCQKEKVIFIGPPAGAIRDMGIKSTSKHIMSAAGVPIINGYHGEDQSDKKLIEEANIIGFPLMIKAVRGGGGKGMRIANDAKEFLDALNSARTESEKSFGDSSVLLERFVRSPRHVEVQVFADQYGDAVYLFERDCSVQRRHQKIIEEAPAPGLSEKLRSELGNAAVRAAKAVSYVGAGTVEFILDKEDLSFHFMEMNTRLQVEHPITEMITGTDLVEWQIRVASGEPLPVTQEQIKRNGHAFEARIYAENPRTGFLPGAGTLEHLTTPEPNENVRVETGVRQGDEVSVFYDPMIAKLVVWGQNRQQALDSLVARLEDYHISGLDTNVNFLIDLAKHTSFRDADVHTGFIPQHFDSLFKPMEINQINVIKAATAFILNEQIAEKINNTKNHSSNPFSASDNFRINYNIIRELKLKFDDKIIDIQVMCIGKNFKIKIENDEWITVSANLLPSENRFSVRSNINGILNNYSCVIAPEKIILFNENGKTEFDIVQPKFLLSQSSANDGGGNTIISPMPGIIDKMLVKPGQTVKLGEPLVVLIAMKMEHVLKAPRDCIIASVTGITGKNVSKGDIIITFANENKE